MTQLPHVSVLLLCRGDARFANDALASIAAQRQVECEVVIVDEGLSQAGHARVDAALEETSCQATARVDATHRDAFESIALGFEVADQPIIACLEVDDVYHAERLALILQDVRDASDPFVAFSSMRFIDALGSPARNESEAVHAYERACLDAARCPSVGFALLRQDLAATRSNLVFSRSLFDAAATAGLAGDAFAEASPTERLLLACLPLVEPVFIAAPLLSRRDLGRSRLVDGAAEARRRHARIAAWLERIGDSTPSNPLAPSRQAWPFYFDLFVVRSLADQPSEEDEDHTVTAPSATPHPAGAWHAWGDGRPNGRGRFLVDPGVSAADRSAVALANEVTAVLDSRIRADRHALGSSLEQMLSESVDGIEPQQPARPWTDAETELALLRAQARGATDDEPSDGLVNDDVASGAPPASSLRRFVRRLRFASLLRHVRDHGRIRRSGIFHARFYRDQAREAGLFVVDPISHYLRTAEKHELAPHPLFDTRYYLARNTDVRGRANPLVHYIGSGDREGRRPHWLFDPDWYRIQHPDVDDRGDHTLEHYLRHGAAEGRAGNPRHDVAGALHEAAGAEGLQRWQKFLKELDEGTNEHGSRIALRRALDENDRNGGRIELARDLRRMRAHARALRRSSLFDPAFYTLWWGRERDTGGDAAQHFLEVGGIEGVGFCGIDRIHERLERLGESFDERAHPEFEYLLRADEHSAPGEATSAAGGDHRVTLYASSKGNVFFTEMAELLARGFRGAGARVEIVDENREPETASPVANEHRIVIAPHEFFLLGRGPEHLSRDFIETTSLWLAEQPGSEFFAMAMWFGARARRILDINPLSALAWTALGYDARALPLGFVEGFDDYRDARPIDDAALAAGLRTVARAPIKTGAPWHERPIDVCFNGVLTPRREAFFAQHAELFAELECALHMPSPHTPVSARLASALMPGDATALSQRSKILLNVHRGETGYFEWHRLAVRGLWQKALVVSETSMPVPCLEPGEHYIEADLDELPDKIEWLLHTPEGREEAERVRCAGHERLRECYDLTSTCRAFLEEDARFEPQWAEGAKA